MRCGGERRIESEITPARVLEGWGSFAFSLCGSPPDAPVALISGSYLCVPLLCGDRALGDEKE